MPIPPVGPVAPGSGLCGLVRAWGPAVAAGLSHVAFAVALEVSWGVHPPTRGSSAAVSALHAALLAGLLVRGWGWRRRRRVVAAGGAAVALHVL